MPHGRCNAWALQRMGAVDPGSANPSIDPIDSPVYATFSLSDPFSSIPDEAVDAPLLEPFTSFTTPHHSIERAPVPLSWETPNLCVLPPLLRDAGLGLSGMRTLPFVGRKAERTALWRALQQPAGHESTRLVLIHGEAGTGKSRLAHWSANRAHEVGAARVIRLRHGPETGEHDVVLRMILEELRMKGKTGKREMAQRVNSQLPGWPDSARETLATRLTARASLDPQQRHALTERWLRTQAEARPLVGVLDDVHWGADALSLAQFLMRRWTHNPQPVLMWLTAREEELKNSLPAAEALRNLMSHAAVRRLALGPPEPSERTELVRELLGLEEELAARVEQRSGGNPMFAIELVGS